MRRRKRGIILERFLIGLLIESLLMPVSLSSVMVIIRSFRFKEDIQDEIALAQLRHILIVADDIETDGKTVSFLYHDANCRLEWINDHLILKPGTQIFLSDLENPGKFFEEGNILYVSYSRDEKQVTRALVSH